MAGEEPNAVDARTKLKMDEYTYDVLSVSKKVFALLDDVVKSEDASPPEKLEMENMRSVLVEQDALDGRLYLKFKDIQQLHKALKNVRKLEGEEAVYLHDVMTSCSAMPVFPQPIPLERPPELEARMEKLRRQFANQDYKQMTKNVSSPEARNESIGKELRVMDSQVMFMFNFVLTVLAAFAFGYKAVEYSLQTPNLSMQLTAGVVLATVVFFADIYFIVKDYDKDTPSFNLNNK